MIVIFNPYVTKHVLSRFYCVLLADQIIVIGNEISCSLNKIYKCSISNYTSMSNNPPPPPPTSR